MPARTGSKPAQASAVNKKNVLFFFSFPENFSLSLHPYFQTISPMNKYPFPRLSQHCCNAGERSVFDHTGGEVRIQEASGLSTGKRSRK
jgi:hypothetical protein